jgi:hypothetical protein
MHHDHREPTTSETGSSASAWRTVGWIGVIVAGIGVGTGAVTGAMVLSDTSSLSGACAGKVCPPGEYEAMDSASAKATVSTVSFIIGGAGLALAAVGLLMGREHSAPRATASATFVTPRMTGVLP